MRCCCGFDLVNVLVFRMCGRDDQQGIVAGDYIVDVLKGKKVAVINDKDTYGKGLADATAQQLTKFLQHGLDLASHCSICLFVTVI